MKKSWKERLSDHRRRYIQLLAAVLMNAHITGFYEGKIYQGKLKAVCTPGLNCYSCPGAYLSCPLGSFQSALVANRNKVPYYVLGMLLLFGALFGRFICGFLCPFGLIQELLYKLPVPKIKKSKVTAVLSRFLCPLGAFYSFFAGHSVKRVEVDEKLCTHCGKCTALCRMDVKKVGDRECICCLECKKHCPHHAIK